MDRQAKMKLLASRAFRVLVKKIMAKHLAIPARRASEWVLSLRRTHSLARRASKRL